MNKYKKEITLVSYTNLPTIKNLINRQGGFIKSIDNFDIQSVKQALKIEKSPNKYRLSVLIAVEVPQNTSLNRVYSGYVNNYKEVKTFLNHLKERHNVGTPIYKTSLKKRFVN